MQLPHHDSTTRLRVRAFSWKTSRKSVCHSHGLWQCRSYATFTSVIVRFSDENETPSLRTFLPERSNFSA